jgi:hypothetical protein
VIPYTSLSRSDLQYLEDGLLLSGTGGWGWWRMPTFSYEALSQEQRLHRLAQEERLVTALSDLECHLLVVPRTYPVEEWAEGLNQRTPRPTDGWPDYLRRVTDHLRGQRIRTREVYLGVRLGVKTPGMWQQTMELIDGLSGRRDPRPDAALLEKCRHDADLLGRKVAAARAGARQATAAELRWLVKRTVWRGIGEDLEDSLPPRRAAAGGEVRELVNQVIYNGHRALQIGEDPGPISYVASLAVAHMPNGLEFPGGAEWLHHFDLLDIPVEASVRFRVEPPRTAAKRVGRQVNKAMDQASHDGEVGGDVSLEVSEVYSEARHLQRTVLRDQMPLVVAWPRLVVAAPDMETLAERVTDVVERYRDMGVELVRPAGDQYRLFQEAMPGGQVQVAFYDHYMPPATLAASMWGASSDLGDNGLGCYFGTTTGVSRGMVTLDPLLAALTNNPTAISITGTLGAGKTATLLKLAYETRLRGAWATIVDPKAEATGLTNMPGIGQARTVSLDGTWAGLLDPFAVEDTPSEAALLAADLCRIFLPPTLAREVETDLMVAASQEAETEMRWATLAGVVRRLESSPIENVRRAAAGLRALAQQPLAAMCFGDRSRADRQLRLDDSLTVIQFSRITLPVAGSPPEDWSISERLSVGLMRAVAALVSTLMNRGTTAQPKVIGLDEAWTVTGATEGARWTERTVRTGRSKNVTVLLASQNARDFLDERIRNCLGVRLAFRAIDAGEIDGSLALLDIARVPDTQAIMPGLQDGECMMRDLAGRVGRVQVDLVTEELRVALNTTPQQMTRAEGAA